DFARNTTGAVPASPQAKLRIKSERGARFADGDHSIVVSNIVDPGSPPREREAGRLRRGIDVQAWLARGLLVPRGWSIKESIAQEDGLDTPRAEHLPSHNGRAFDGN